MFASCEHLCFFYKITSSYYHRSIDVGFLSLRETCPNTESFVVHIFLYSVRIRSKSPYSVRIQGNTDQKNSVFGHFSHSVSNGNQQWDWFWYCLNTRNWLHQKMIRLHSSSSSWGTLTCSKPTVETLEQGVRCEICSNLTIKTPKRLQWRGSGILIVNFDCLYCLCCFYYLYC